MKILIIEPQKAPEVREIDNSLQAMQAVVGGTIQAIYPFKEPVALICNDEGKVLGLPANRALRDESGELYDIICGTFFFCAAPPDSDDFASLTDEQIRIFAKSFAVPEMFLQVNGKLMVLPYLEGDPLA